MRLATIHDVERRLTEDAIMVQAMIFGKLNGCMDTSLFGEWVNDRIWATLQPDGSIKLGAFDNGVLVKSGLLTLSDLVDEALTQYPDMFKQKKGIKLGQDIEDAIEEAMKQQGAIPIH